MHARLPRFTIRRLILLIAVFGVVGGMAVELCVHRPRRDARRQEITGLRQSSRAIRGAIRYIPTVTGHQVGNQVEVQDLADRFDQLADELEAGVAVDRDEVRELIARLESGVVLFRRADGNDPAGRSTP